ncbi:hypothetical protein TNCV_3837601 [Trichonephila clavipes]|nr:hypothetical protein TNCV_3837601 [Trichonephila clavipes]
MEEQKHTIQHTEEYRLLITNDDPRIERKRCAAFHLIRESISVVMNIPCYMQSPSHHILDMLNGERSGDLAVQGNV